MEKYDYISELAENTAFEIVQNQEEWKKYLTTAARLYKYPFREQLLIYAQRPDATACNCWLCNVWCRWKDILSISPLIILVTKSVNVQHIKKQ